MLLPPSPETRLCLPWKKTIFQLVEQNVVNSVGQGTKYFDWISEAVVLVMMSYLAVSPLEFSNWMIGCVSIICSWLYHQSLDLWAIQWCLSKQEIQQIDLLTFQVRKVFQGKWFGHFCTVPSTAMMVCDFEKFWRLWKRTFLNNVESVKNNCFLVLYEKKMTMIFYLIH